MVLSCTPEEVRLALAGEIVDPDSRCVVQSPTIDQACFLGAVPGIFIDASTLAIDSVCINIESDCWVQTVQRTIRV